MIFRRLKQKPEEFDPFEVAQKGSSVIKSCNKVEQVPAARRYANLLMEQKKEQMVPTFIRNEKVSKRYDTSESAILATAVGITMANAFLDSQEWDKKRELEPIEMLDLEDIPDGDYENARPDDNNSAEFSSVELDFRDDCCGSSSFDSE